MLQVISRGFFLLLIFRWCVSFLEKVVLLDFCRLVIRMIDGLFFRLKEVVLLFIRLMSLLLMILIISLLGFIEFRIFFWLRVFFLMVFVKFLVILQFMLAVIRVWWIFFMDCVMLIFVSLFFFFRVLKVFFKCLFRLLNIDMD